MVMAKAAVDTITGWTFLNDARERIGQVHGSYTAAEHIIEQGLQRDTLRRRSTLVMRKGKDVPKLQTYTLGGSPILLPGGIPATINYAENFIDCSRCTEYGVQLANEDLNKLPGATVSIDSVDSPNKSKSGGRKLTQAVELLKEMYPPDGLPPAGTSTKQITQEARVICERRRESAPSDDTFRRARHQLTGK
jgi:hypothetical protein